ncbi:MAG: hypothetical protein ABJQ14_00750 [Hyphomicrobiales bacterium]
MKLKQAAEDLYDLIRKDPDVQANVGKPVQVNDKPRAVLTSFTPKNREANLLALEHILHSLSYIASQLSKQLRYIGIPLNQEGYRQGGAYEHRKRPIVTACRVNSYSLKYCCYCRSCPLAWCNSRLAGRFRRAELISPSELQAG